MDYSKRYAKLIKSNLNQSSLSAVDLKKQGYLDDLDLLNSLKEDNFDNANFN